MSLKLSNEAVLRYLEYVEDTESPRLFHIWSFLAGVGACLGRRVYLDFGIDNIYANQFVIITGPPGSRKSTAMKITERLLKQATNIRFAPDDTAGQRQGLIAAMEGDAEEDEETAEAQAQLEAAAQATLDAISTDKVRKLPFSKVVDPRDRHVMMAAASEFASLIGERSQNMTIFLSKCWDGEDYEYKLKAQSMILTEPLLAIVGCIQPGQIAESFPSHSIGQGFTSRLIFVYGARKYKKVPRPVPLPEHIADEMRALFGDLFYKFDGEIKETPAAAKLLDDLYDVKVELDDPRFVFYIDRRQTHLIKLAICLAAARRSMVIDVQDINDAQTILAATEVSMPDALGEFGMSPLGAAKQKMMDYLRSAMVPVPLPAVSALMRRDMTSRDFNQAVNELINANELMMIRNERQEPHLVIVDKKQQDAVVELAELGLTEATGD